MVFQCIFRTDFHRYLSGQLYLIVLFFNNSIVATRGCGGSFTREAEDRTRRCGDAETERGGKAKQRKGTRQGNSGSGRGASSVRWIAEGAEQGANHAIGVPRWLARLGYSGLSETFIESICCRCNGEFQAGSGILHGPA